MSNLTRDANDQLSPHFCFLLALPFHRPSLLRLLYLQLGEETDEPLEGSLLSVDPEEVHFPQVHHLRFEIIGPAIGTLGTRVPGSPVSKHVKCQLNSWLTGIQIVRGLNEGVFCVLYCGLQ